MDAQPPNGLTTSQLEKGKQRAVSPELVQEPEVPKKQRNKYKKSRATRTREILTNSRPILTIKSSQGFVWNQDLFVPSYIKDRYFVSTSPPTSRTSSNSCHPVPMLASSADTLNDYEVDVVEIRVTGDELRGILS